MKTEIAIPINDPCSPNFVGKLDPYFRSEVSGDRKWPAARRMHISLRELKMLGDNKEATGR